MGRRNAATAKAERAERRRNQTAEEILDAAHDVLLRDGLDRFKLSAVAEQLGLTTPALYYYFGSREALVGELLLREWLGAAREVEAAVAETETGADALEAMMRVTFERYRDQLDLFSLVYRTNPPEDLQSIVGPEQLERVRPVNDMLYGGVEQRLRSDQREGCFPKKRDARRFAFNAHMAVIGVLTMKALAESAGDPLVHRDDDLIDDLCRTFRTAAREGASQ